METVEWRGYGVARTPVLEETDRVDTIYERTLTLSAWRDDNAEYLLSDYAGYNRRSDPDFKLALGIEAVYPIRLAPGDIFPWPQPFTSARNVSLQPSRRYPFSVSGWNNVLRGFPCLEWLRLDRELAPRFLFSVYTSSPPTLPRSLQCLALLGFRRDVDEDGFTDVSYDEMLAQTWRETRKEGGSLQAYIMGDVSVEGDGFEDCIGREGVVVEVVRRPYCMQEGHEDWDDLTEY
ncbi:unnamed protein product [Peniophora sp. CBMAI 1063]|nr:unnamed protein product [Peniophora sp. CBMAI 1063]